MKYILSNVNIIDGASDCIIKGKSIVVEDGIIKDIAEDISNYRDYKIINLANKYIMPGLINLHVHLPGSGNPSGGKSQNKKTVDFLMKHFVTRKIVTALCKKYAKIELKSGVTTIRTVGGLQDIDSKLRDLNSTELPRILSSNMAISVPNGHMAGVLAYEAVDIPSALKYLDMIKETKPDLIKLMITGGVLDAKVKGEPGALKMQADIVKALCSKAHEYGYKVAAHVESPEGVRVALLNGVDTIEHGAELDEEMIQLFKEGHQAHVCTISPAIVFKYFDKKDLYCNDVGLYNGQLVFKGIVDCARACLENNILVGLGTDTACPYVTHYNMWRELIYFKNFCHVSNSFAINTATLTNAKIAGIDKETGSIEIGKSADMIVVAENPLVNLKTLKEPKKVIFKGKITNKPRIKKDALVEEKLDNILEQIYNN